MHPDVLHADPPTGSLSAVLSALTPDPVDDPVRKDESWHPTLDSLLDALAVVDAGGEIVAVNRAWRRFGEANGGASGGELGNYLDVCDRAAPTDPIAAEVAQGMRDVAAGRRPDFTCVYPCHAPDQERWYSMQVAKLRDGGAPRLVVTHHDTTVRQQAQRRNQDQADLLDAVGAAITVTDPAGIITHWSDGAESLYGWAAADVIGRSMATVTDAREDGASAGGHGMVGEDDQWECYPEVRHRDGRRFPVNMRNRLLLDGEGEPAGVIGVSVDVTERVDMERQLRGARDFRDAILQTMPDGLYVLDGGGRVTLINETAERMLGWPRGALLGVVLHEELQALTAEGAPRPTAERLDARALAAGGSVRVDDDAFRRRDGTFVPVTYSAAPFTGEAGQSGSVVVFKDITARKARELDVHRELEALTWVNRIHEALEHDLFVLHAQPIVDVASGRTIQHELLLRMLCPEGELIPPGDFLPIAEQHGLIGAIDHRVFEMALGYAAAGHAIEVNLSADSVGDPGLFTFVQDAIEAHGVDPRLIVFEITETALIHNEAAAKTFTEAVVELGCAVALDDFGTGYGTFHYLKHLPVSHLKIDREFVRDLDEDGSEASRLVISAIVTLARGMGMTTVAEGVETEGVLEVVRQLGVDSAQGYLFARPVPADDVFTGLEQ